MKCREWSWDRDKIFEVLWNLFLHVNIGQCYCGRFLKIDPSSVCCLHLSNSSWLWPKKFCCNIFELGVQLFQDDGFSAKVLWSASRLKQLVCLNVVIGCCTHVLCSSATCALSVNHLPSVTFGLVADWCKSNANFCESNMLLLLLLVLSRYIILTRLMVA